MVLPKVFTVFVSQFQNEQSQDLCAPSGWPLCLGRCGVVINFTCLDSSLLRNHDCYLALRHRNRPGLEVNSENSMFHPKPSKLINLGGVNLETTPGNPVSYSGGVPQPPKLHRWHNVLQLKVSGGTWGGVSGRMRRVTLTWTVAKPLSVCWARHKKSKWIYTSCRPSDTYLKHFHKTKYFTSSQHLSLFK